MQDSSFISNSNLRFGVKVLLFLLAVVILDFGLGQTLEAIYFHQTSGKFHRIAMAMDRSQADILVLGSSRAIHHYDSRILEARTGLSVYNAGSRGQDILYCHAVLEASLKRYHPRLVILNLDTMLFDTGGKFGRLSDLFPFYASHPEIRPLLNQKSRFENVKLMSSLYAYNSTLLHLINYEFIPQPDFNGYIPLGGQAEMAVAPGTNAVFADQIMDPDYLNSYRRILEACRAAGVPVVIALSPNLTAIENRKIDSMRVALDTATALGLEIWDHSYDSEFIGHPEHFSDASHLNDAGSTIFTKKIAEQVVESLSLHP